MPEVKQPMPEVKQLTRLRAMQSTRRVKLRAMQSTRQVKQPQLTSVREKQTCYYEQERRILKKEKSQCDEVE